MRSRPELASVGSGTVPLRHAAPAWLDGPLLRRSGPDGTACHFNPAWQSYTGLTPDNSSPDAWLQDIHPADRSRCRSIHAEMLRSLSPYALDYRLRHVDQSYRWVMERAVPVTAPDGRFDGFEHHAIDVHDRTELGEALAERLRRMRGLQHAHAAFAAALAGELDRLPSACVKAALGACAALTGASRLRRCARRPVADWLGRIVDEACASLPPGPPPFVLHLPAEPLEIAFDSTVLNLAMTNALACTALLSGTAWSAGAAALTAQRQGGALVIDLPALPGSSALALLELALQARGLPGAQFGSAGDSLRRRITLPLADDAAPKRTEL